MRRAKGYLVHETQFSGLLLETAVNIRTTMPNVSLHIPETWDDGAKQQYLGAFREGFSGNFCLLG